MVEQYQVVEYNLCIAIKFRNISTELICSYDLQVWTPSGGWYCDPKLWKRNTAFAFGAVALVVVPLFLKSASLEVCQIGI